MGGGPPRVSPFGVIPFYDVYCDEDFLFQFIGSPSTYAAQTHGFFGEEPIFLVFAYIWTENSLNFWRRPFFLVFTNFTNRGVTS